MGSRQQWDPQQLATVARSNRAGDWAIHLTGSLQRQRHLQTVVAVLTTHQGCRGGKGSGWAKNEGPVRKQHECRNVALCGRLATPRQTHAHQKSSDPPFLFMPPWDLQRIKDGVITTITCRCLLERRALTALWMDSSVSTCAAAHSVMSNTRCADLKHCFILSYHRNYKCNLKLQENILTIFPLMREVPSFATTKTPCRGDYSSFHTLYSTKAVWIWLKTGSKDDEPSCRNSRFLI